MVSGRQFSKYASSSLCTIFPYCLHSTICWLGVQTRDRRKGMSTSRRRHEDYFKNVWIEQGMIQLDVVVDPVQIHSKVRDLAWRDSGRHSQAHRERWQKVAQTTRFEWDLLPFEVPKCYSWWVGGGKTTTILRLTIGRPSRSMRSVSIASKHHQEVSERTNKFGISIVTGCVTLAFAGMLHRIG